MRKTGIRVRELHEQLGKLMAFIDGRSKSEGGRPRRLAWDAAMLQLADFYTKRTGKRPTVWKNKFTKDRFTSPFVKLAAIVDRQLSEAVGERPRSNSELGYGLEELLPKRR